MFLWSISKISGKSWRMAERLRVRHESIQRQVPIEGWIAVQSAVMKGKDSILEEWLKKLDRRPRAFPAMLGGLGGFSAAMALTADSVPKALGLGAVAALGGAAGWLALGGEPYLEGVLPEPVSKPKPILDPIPGPKDLDLWVEIPGGTFLMGSPPDEERRLDHEGPQHLVTLSPFRMMRVPVTRRLYLDVMSEDPGWPTTGEDLLDRPVNNVSFVDAAFFCNRRSERDGLQKVYHAGKRTGPFKNDDVLQWAPGAIGYRLPTEAEWEYACRAGSTSKFCFGDAGEQLGEYAWFKANTKELQPVGRKLPNAWGLHDMHGNVWEWCWDHLGPYQAEPQLDPKGPPDRSPSLLRPVVRGGSVLSMPGRLRSAYRLRFRPDNRDRGLGFRCVLGSRPVPGTSAS